MNLMWSKIFFLILIIIFFSNPIYGEEKILLTYKDPYLIRNMDITKMIYNFLLHFNLPIDEVRFKDLKKEELYKYKYIIIPVTDTIPTSIQNELPKLKESKVCIIGKAKNLNLARYNGEKKGFSKVTYQGINYFISPKNLIYTYTLHGKGKVLATVSDEKNKIPILLKYNNIFLLGEFPLWDEQSYFFANFLYDFLDISYVKAAPKVLLIIQDINPYTKPENLKDTIKILERERIPFVISYYPLYFDVDRNRFTTIKEMKALSFFLDVLSKRGVNFILSGLLKKYYKEKLQRDAEFWDIKEDKPIKNFKSYFENRIFAAFTLSREVGVYPVGFMPSEFAFPPEYMNLVGKYFDYYIGTIQLNNYTYKPTQSLPYIIKDLKKDLYIITPNLGYISKENPSLSLSNIIEKAKKLRFTKGAFGVVYFHPFLDKKYLKELISNFLDLGYEFSNLPYLKEYSEKAKNIKYFKKINFSHLPLKEENKKLKEVGKTTGVLLFGLSLFFVLIGLGVYLFTTRKNYKELFKILLLTFGISLVFSFPSYGKTAVVIGEKKSDMVMIANLLGHFNIKVDGFSDTNFYKTQAENADLLFFISNNDHKISKDIIELFTKRKDRENCFIGSDPEEIIKKGKYPLTYMGVTKEYPYLIYKGINVFNEWDMYVPLIISKEGKVYGYFSNLKEKIPAYIKTKNLWIIGGSPFYSFTGIAFSDLLHDIVGENHKEIPKALIRIEDINPDYPLKILKKTTDYLIKNYLPFAMAFYPIYMNFDLKESVTLDRRPKMVEYLRSLDQYRGRIIMHGITHQYSKKEISGEGSEFWDMIHNRPIPNFKEYFEKRISYGISLFKRLGIPFYAFEPPHYNLSLEGEFELKKYIPIYVGQVMIDDPEVTQEFYYPIYKSYAGLFIIPENLGYVEKEDPKESIERILYKARIIKKMVRDPFVGFFFHPFMGVKYLKPIIEGLDKMGYYFVDLKREVPPLKLPQVKEVKVEELNLPFYYNERKGFKASTKSFSILAVVSVLILVVVYTSKKRGKRY